MLKKKKFSQWDKDSQLRLCVIPQYVSVTKNPDDETDEQIIERQDKVISLPVFVRKKLSSPITGEKIQEIGEKYNLELLQMASIARIIRSYYFGEVKLENFPQILSQEIKIDLNKAQEISDLVIKKIIEDDSQKKVYQSKLSKLIIEDALEKYPDLGEQLVTSNHIKLKNFPEPVRPNIKNWLSDYIFNTGHDSHDSMIRGIYLFQNENTKILNSSDRQKLAYLLKAYDENSPVNVNTILKQIIFPATKSAQPTSTESSTSSEAEKKVKPKDIFQLENQIDTKQKNVGEIKTAKDLSFKSSQKNLSQEISKPKKTAPIRENHSQKILPKNNIISNLVKPKKEKDQSPQEPLHHHSSDFSRPQLNFTSPQKMPFEKQTAPVKTFENNPQPLKITPAEFQRENKENEKKFVQKNKARETKNIVNLKKT